MPWLRGSSVLLLLTVSVSWAQERETIQLLYQRRTITVASGSSVTLSCHARYDLDRCGLLEVAWTKDGAELKDPDRFVTTVSEKISGDNVRLRQVEMEILRLTTDDQGQFQCKAECANKEDAMGHFITVQVQG